MQFRFVAIITALVILFQPWHTHAQIETQWIGADGAWSEPANWSNGLPFGNFNATLGSNTGIVTQDIGNLLINGLVFDSQSGNLVLDQRMSILSDLSWTGGKISGAESLDFYGDGLLTEVNLETTFRNFGRMQIGDPDQFTQLNSFTANAHWINKSGGEMSFNNGTVVGSFSGDQFFQGMINNEVGATMCFHNSANYILWDTVNDGVIEIGVDAGGFGGALFVKKFSQSSSGEVQLNEGFIDFFDEVSFDGKISGNGSVLNLSSTFDGELNPGGPQLGTIDVAGALVMVPETVTKFQIGPNQQSDLITNIGGPLQLNGTLDLQAIPGAIAGAYTIFTYNNGSGLDISNVNLGQTPTGFAGSIVLDQPNSRVQLVVDAIDDVVAMNSIKALTGSISSGGLDELAVNDGQKVMIVQDDKSKSGTIPVSFTADATLPDATSTSLRVRIDSSANNDRLQQQVALFNFDSSVFESIGASSMTGDDQTVDLVVDGDASRFVDTGGLVRVLVEYQPTVRRNLGWAVNVDQLNFVAGQ